MIGLAFLILAVLASLFVIGMCALGARSDEQTDELYGLRDIDDMSDREFWSRVSDDGDFQ